MAYLYREMVQLGREWVFNLCIKCFHDLDLVKRNSYVVGIFFILLISKETVSGVHVSRVDLSICLIVLDLFFTSLFLLDSLKRNHRKFVINTSIMHQENN